MPTPEEKLFERGMCAGQMTLLLAIFQQHEKLHPLFKNEYKKLYTLYVALLYCHCEQMQYL